MIVPNPGHVRGNSTAHGSMFLVFVGLCKSQSPAKVPAEKFRAGRWSRKAHWSTVLEDVYNPPVGECGFAYIPLELSIGVRE